MTNYNSCNMTKLYNISFNVIWLSFKKRWGGGHRKLMVSWLRPNLNVNQFIDELMKEWEFIECQIFHMESGGAKKDLKRTMNKSDRDRAEKIRRVIERASTYASPIDYLHALAMATKKV